MTTLGANLTVVGYMPTLGAEAGIAGTNAGQVTAIIVFLHEGN